MRSPLLLPGLTFVVLAGVLVVLLRVFFALGAEPPDEAKIAAAKARAEELAQEAEAWAKTPGPRLPVSRQGKPERRANMEMTLKHVAADGASCPKDCQWHHWLVRLTADGLHDNGMLSNLASIAQRTTLGIRAPADADFGWVMGGAHHVVSDLVYRFELVVVSAENGSELRVPFLGPHELSWKGNALDVYLRREPATGRYERCMSWDLDAGPKFSSDETGNRQLQAFLNQEVSQGGDRGWLSFVRVARDVPLQAVVDLLDQLGAAGLDYVELTPMWN